MLIKDALPLDPHRHVDENPSSFPQHHLSSCSFCKQKLLSQPYARPIISSPPSIIFCPFLLSNFPRQTLLFNIFISFPRSKWYEHEFYGMLKEWIPSIFQRFWILSIIKKKSTYICIWVNTYYCRNIKVLCPCCFFGTCIEVVAVSAKQRHLPSSSNHASSHFQR